MGVGKLFWKLFLGNVILAVVVLGVCVWVILDQVNDIAATRLENHLRQQAITIGHVVEAELRAQASSDLQARISRLHDEFGRELRVTLILPDGRVMADSEANPKEMDLHNQRPEVIDAMRAEWGTSTRFSHTVNRQLRYVAHRIGPSDSPIGVVRVAMPIERVGLYSRSGEQFALTVVGVGLLAAVLLAMGLARLWSGPVRRITELAQSFSLGDLSKRVPVQGSDEWAVLGRSLNRMRDNLLAQLETIDRQRRTLESLLVQVHEGVIVSRPDGKLVLINPAARRLLGIPESAEAGVRAFEGRALETVVPHQELQKLLECHRQAPADSPEIDEARIQVEGPDGPITVLARATEIALPTFEHREEPGDKETGPPSGRLLVLTDVTELSRMIQVKTDFASNASHELRTPLSAIRVAVETLLNTDPAEDAESFDYCLGVIDRHSARLQQMVADLMDLAKLESSQGEFKAENVNVRELFGDLNLRHEERLRDKTLRWEIDVPDTLGHVYTSAHLLRLAMDNLVDNAIKFTESGGVIRLGCRIEPGESQGRSEAVFSVADTGCGIPEADQSRVFERFYQVERARSGSIRGTGLGLSIVRHAVGAMKGTVSLSSRAGEGTTVTIRIPLIVKSVREPAEQGSGSV